MDRQFLKGIRGQYDAVAIDIKTRTVLWVDGPTTLSGAEATVAMSVARQGCDDRFYSKAPHGTYKKGDAWTGDRM